MDTTLSWCFGPNYGYTARRGDETKEFAQMKTKIYVDNVWQEVEIPDEQLHAAKSARLQKALNHIQRAQNELGSACGELSALCGAVPQWKGASKLYDQVHAFWYRVDGLRHKKGVRLDSINIDAIARRLHATVEESA